jgi:hypothetical protein
LTDAVCVEIIKGFYGALFEEKAVIEDKDVALALYELVWAA